MPWISGGGTIFVDSSSGQFVPVPLAHLVPAGVDSAGMPTRARIVLYRRPLEARARNGEDLADLVHEVLVEQVAEYLNIEPDAVDGG